MVKEDNSRVREARRSPHVWERVQGFLGTWADYVLQNYSEHSRKLGLDKPVPRDPTLFLQQDSVTEHLIQSVLTGIY